jgi:DNA-binding NarL/FixJ family response regulator
MRQVIYFDKNDKNYNSRALSTVGDFTNSSVHVIDNWAELVKLMSNPEDAIEFTLVLFSNDLLEVPGTTLNEIVDAMSTITTLTGQQKKIAVGVVVNEKCSSTTVNHFKKSNVNGIVPSIMKFGSADFYEAIDILLTGSLHWPADYIQSKAKPAKQQVYGIKLTDRQQEIMALVANRGLSNKKIAQILNISESTVKVHISSILKAYGVRNRTQLALAGSRGLHA